MELEAPARQTIERAAAVPVEHQEAADLPEAAPATS